MNLTSKQYDILLVEDVPIAKTAAKLTLKKLGHHIDIASTGYEAIDLAQKKPYHMIFMDIGLPDINGFEATKQIQKNSKNKKTFLVALTAHQEKEYLQTAKSMGINQFIIKPITTDKIHTIIKNFNKHQALLTSKITSKITLDNLTFHHQNKLTAKALYKTIFSNQAYFFETNNPSPTIIDCGSNIGLATLYMKSRYPNAHILCFEPDPNAFPILQKNIKLHRLNNVNAINAAIANREGKIDFYGEIFTPFPDSRGNSIIPTWGNRGFTDKIQVDAVKLSTYITREIDFLKLDVEGAEQQVLEELGDTLNYIKAMTFQVHETKQNKPNNNINSIIDLLTKFNFKLQVIEEDVQAAFPERLQSWVKTADPKLYIVKAWK